MKSLYVFSTGQRSRFLYYGLCAAPFQWFNTSNSFSGNHPSLNPYTPVHSMRLQFSWFSKSLANISDFDWLSLCLIKSFWISCPRCTSWEWSSEPVTVRLACYVCFGTGSSVQCSALFMISELAMGDCGKFIWHPDPEVAFRGFDHHNE